MQQKLRRRDEEYQAVLSAASHNEALQRELAALRQLALGTLEVTPTATDGQLLAGSGIDAPASRCQVTAEEIVVEGWVLGRNCAVAAVELVGPKATLRQAPVLLRRPDVAAAHPQVSWAETSGFRITMSAREMAQASRVELRAALKDDSSVCLGVIRALRGDGSDDLLTAAEAKVSQLRKDAEEASTREAKLQEKLRRRDEEYQAVLSAASHNEALQRELAALRQLALGTLEVTPTATDGQLLAGSGIDAPASRCQVTAEEIVVEGWVLGRNCAVAAVELVGPKATLRQAPVLLRRPDVAAAHPQVSWAETSGFRITMSAREMAQASRVELRAVLKDDSSVCLGVIRALRGDAVECRQDLERASAHEVELSGPLSNAHDRLLRHNQERQTAFSAPRPTARGRFCPHPRVLLAKCSFTGSSSAGFRRRPRPSCRPKPPSSW